ncbi:21205_t:CDS:1, partial [Gigaspora margarita]
CIESIPSNYKTDKSHEFIELNEKALDIYIKKDSQNQNKRMYSINPLSACA